MLKKTIIAGLLGCIMLPAFASNWVQVSHNKYVDSNSIKPSNAYGTFTFKAKAVADRAPFETQEDIRKRLYLNFT